MNKIEVWDFFLKWENFIGHDKTSLAFCNPFSLFSSTYKNSNLIPFSLFTLKFSNKMKSFKRDG